MGYYINKFFSTKMMLFYLVLILFLGNYALFWIFQMNNPTLSIYKQIFGYFDSKIFQIYSVSLMFPIIFLLIDNIFKLREKRMEEKKERKVETIKFTQELWDDLAKITAEFVYNNNIKNSEEIGKIHSKIDDFIIKGEAVVNSWHIEFYDLKELLNTEDDDIDFSDILLMPFNVLLSSILSIIDFKELDTYNDDDMRLSQEYVLLIYDGIRGSLHQQILRLLKNAMLYNENNNNKTKNKIIEDYEYIKTFSFKLIKEIYEDYPSDDSNYHLKDTYSFIEEMKDNDNYDYEKFKLKMQEYFDKIPNGDKCLLKGAFQFSNELIKKLAYILKIQELNADYNHLRDQYMSLKSELENNNNSL